MSNLEPKNDLNALEQVLVTGNLSALTSDQRVSYYNKVCDSLGLNPLTKPFDYITLNNKLTLYAKRDATDQLRKVHGVSVVITDRSLSGDIYVVTARAKNKEGREDESIGAVNIAGLRGDALANAYMKAETKAKRRVTLSVCGLGMLDETEAETVRDVTPEQKLVEKLEYEKKPDEPKDVPFDHGSYVVKHGKQHKGKTLKEIDIYQLANHVSWLEQQYELQNKPYPKDIKEFMTHANEFLKSRELPREPL